MKRSRRVRISRYYHKFYLAPKTKVGRVYKIKKGIIFATKAIDVLRQRIFKKIKNIDSPNTLKYKVRSKITNFPFIGGFIAQLYAKVMGFLRFYIEMPQILNGMH